MNIISKISTLPSGPAGQKPNDPSSPAPSPALNARNHNVPPSLSTNALSVPGSMDTSTMGLTEKQLRRQALECLVTVLRSLVAWGTAAGKTLAAEEVPMTPLTATEDNTRRESGTLESTSSDQLGASGSNPELLSRQGTPDLADDPSRFEVAKHKKTALLEGIKKFNFKPKRVSCGLCTLFSLHSDCTA